MSKGKIFTRATLTLGAALVLVAGDRTTGWTAPQPHYIANISDATYTECDMTGGHCARLHVVLQTQDATQLRSFASITCYSASGDSACAALSGSAFLNCTGLGGTDCGVDGPVVKCGAMYGKPACPKVLSVVSPWYRLPVQTQTYSAAATFAFTTGAAGGGTGGISARTPDVNF